jgi:two-component sensor histidine kinase
MDKQVKNCPGLTDADLDLLQRIEDGLPIAADISRADILVCALLSPTRALVISHAMPASISSLYRGEAVGRTFTREEQPLILRALTSGSGGRWQREVLRNGAPIIQDVYPIHGEISLHGQTDHTGAGKTIGAFVVETNMLAYERQRRRNRYFRRAVPGVLQMCLHGEIKNAGGLGRFGIYDGIYLVDHERRIRYVSGNATNLFRAAGIVRDPHGAHISMLEATDAELVEETFQKQQCLEERHEANDGRIWIRRAVPLRMPPPTWMQWWLGVPWYYLAQRKQAEIDAVIVMIHNATETVQKQRELNVKSAIIQEVHHRVKNNLQNIAAILRIQARRCESEEAKQHLTDAVNRVLSMSVIHEFLSQDEHRPINLRDVCQRIATQVAQVSSNPEQEIDIRVQGQNIRLPASQATPAAMVVNELLLNAVEHGLRDRRRGEIRLTLRDLGDAVELVVTDNGNGLPTDFGVKPSRSLGLQIVQTLVTDDLKGAVTIESLATTAAEKAKTAVAEGSPTDNATAEPAYLVDEKFVGDNGPSDSIPRTPAEGETEQEEPLADHGTKATIRFPKRSLGID